MHVNSVHRCFVGCERVRLSIPKPDTVPVHRPRPPTTCTRSLPAEHRVMGHQAIPLVRISKIK